MKSFKQFSEEKPCWPGYEMVGMKKKRGKQVPNCVPVKEDAIPSPHAKENAIKAALNAMHRLVMSKGKAQSLSGYAFDIAKSYNIGLGARELAAKYREVYGLKEDVEFVEYDEESQEFDLHEGVNDPGIFKAVFMAGGPGSGKSTVAGVLALKAMGLVEINSDTVFEVKLKQHGLDMKMPDHEAHLRDPLRAVAKNVTKNKKTLALQGRLGVVIDGTGKDADEIFEAANALKALGYDVAMIFVDTSLDTAHARNRARPRSVPDHILKASWKAVQDNKDAFAKFFGPHFIRVDNSDGVNLNDMNALKPAFSKARAFVKAPPSSQRAKEWINAERAARLGTPK